MSNPNKRDGNGFYIDPLIFIIAFSIGILYTYVCHNPEKKHIIIKYPTSITNNPIYLDDSGTCYTYDVSPAKCPANKKDIFVVPIQDSIKRQMADIEYIKKPSLTKRLYQRFF
jgi:hypothetical protein